ncbi:MAG: F0F1 ATP synthase subunit B [Phycisphaerae bacterium]
MKLFRSMVAGGVLALTLLLSSGVALAQENVATSAPAEVVAGVAGHEKAGEAVGKTTAAGEEKAKDPLMEETKNISSYVFTILVFLVLLVILRVTAWKPILQGLKSREESIRDSIAAAGKARDEAARTALELESRIAEAQRQGAHALVQAKADALKLADGIKAQAETESAALKERALRDIEAAKQQAIAEINGHAADLGTAIARKILQRNVTVEDQQRLVDESLAQLQTSKN